MRPKNISRPGFTLTEMLVVLAIIELLAAILFPVFTSAREAARQTVCLSNQRQIGMAILQYVQDNDECFPNGINPTPGWFWAGEGWAGQLSSYVKSPDIFRCSDDPTQGAPPTDYVVSYGYNINLVQPATDGNPFAESGYFQGAPPPGQPLSALSSPSRTVALFEVSGITANVTDPREGAGDPADATWMGTTTYPGEGAEPGEMMGQYFSASSNGLDNRLYANNKDTTTLIANVYATGYLGNRTPPDPAKTQFQPQFGRHSSGSNFLLADGHTRWLHGTHVSAGLNADTVDAPQGMTDASFSAAGTGSPHFAATFSIR